MQDIWTENADAILKYAKNQTDRGNPFPLFCTCLGFQLISYLTSNYNPGILSQVHDDVAAIHPLDLTTEESYLFKTLSKSQL